MKAKREVCIEAINLKTHKLSGYKLLSVYSKEYGLLKLSGSKLGGRSEPFVRNLFWIQMTEGADIHKIVNSEFQEHFSSLSLSLERMSTAWYFADYLEACSHPNEDRSQEIFSLFLNSLKELSNQVSVPDLDSITISFMWDLARLLGYKPNLRMCNQEAAECSINRNQDLRAWFDFEAGGILCEKCSERPSYDSVIILPGIYKCLKLLDEGKTLNECPKGAVSFVTQLLQRYLQRHTNRKMKSLEVYARLK